MGLAKEVNEAYIKHINKNFDMNREAAASLKEHIERSPLWMNGALDKTLQIPKVFDEETIEKLRGIGNTMYTIFGKVADAYRNDPEFRKLFPFSKELEDLILIPRRFDGFLPIARFDLFYHEDTGDFYFCEVNTDGTADQLRGPEFSKAMIVNPAHQAVIRKYDLKQFELFDSFIAEFMKLYRSYIYRKGAGSETALKPNIAIADILDKATMYDLEEFARHFQAAGMNCEICDLRKLTYRNGMLYSETDNKIDAIYRRAVTADILEYYDEVTDFLNAVRDDAVFLAGAFETQIIHNKWLFHVLHTEYVKVLLTDEENKFIREHVPGTWLFGPSTDEVWTRDPGACIALNKVQSDKDNYIIKPMDAYASKGMYASGREYTQDEWNEITEKYYGEGLICQEYCPQYETENIDFAWGDGKWHTYTNMPGLYMYNGNFSGILMRMAQSGRILVALDTERTAPVYVVTGKRE